MANADSNALVAVVTGASRGVGKGIALALGKAGATVYVTGRSTAENEHSPLPGTVAATANEISNSGGTGVAVICDHRDDQQIKSLFEQVINDQGRIDVLVNNVFCVPDDLLEQKPFWERADNHWADMIDLGLRAHYVACCQVAPQMVEQQSGLIINISSPGSVCYMHAPVYGIGKAGCDKMIQDIGKELAEHNVAAIGLWPGIVTTERTTALMEMAPDAYTDLAAGLESPEFAGRIIHALLNSDDLMSRTGKAWYTSELGLELGVKDVDGRQPASYREMLGSPTEPAPAMIR